MPLQIDDSWARDSGPTFITTGPLIAGVDWTFNNYGENVFFLRRHSTMINIQF